ncbi:solute carrier organic anion transporter family member 2B1-like X3, partial [Biomphalaria glabrata]
ISNCNMADLRLSFEERKQIIKWYWKFENVAAVRRQWRRENGTEPPSRLTITRLRDKFEIHGTVCDVHKG